MLFCHVETHTTNQIRLPVEEHPRIYEHRWLATSHVRPY